MVWGWEWTRLVADWVIIVWVPRLTANHGEMVLEGLGGVKLLRGLRQNLQSFGDWQKTNTLFRELGGDYFGGHQ
jgi:hypothetical protein